MQHAKYFYKQTELQAPIIDIIIIGSSAGYNWTPTSDIDVHIVIDFKQINKDQEVTYELSTLFDKINEMFRTSTQYLESKKKINYNQCNHNKWELKKEVATRKYLYS